MQNKQYRIVGTIGPSEIEVKTEWLDGEVGTAIGLELGLDIRGWSNTEIEEREKPE